MPDSRAAMTDGDDAAHGAQQGRPPFHELPFWRSYIAVVCGLVLLACVGYLLWLAGPIVLGVIVALLFLGWTTAAIRDGSRNGWD